MSEWDPTGILTPNVKIDTQQPVYDFMGQTVQYGTMFASERWPEGYSLPQPGPAYCITSLGRPIDVLQFFINTYGGVGQIPRSTIYLYFSDIGQVSTVGESTFVAAQIYVNGKSYYMAGLTGGIGLPLQESDVLSYTSARGYTGTDLDSIRDIDHSFAHMYFFMPDQFSGETDLTESPGGHTNTSIRCFMQYQVKNMNGEWADINGCLLNMPRFIEGAGVVPQTSPSLAYKAPNSIGSWYNGHLPATLILLIENYTEQSAETGGGDGNYGYQSDSISHWELPTVGFVDSGFIRIFAPTLQQVKDLCSYMWTDDVLTNLKKMFADNPLNSIINLGLLPVNLASVRGAAVTVDLGTQGTGVSMYPLTEQYISVPMGSVTVMENWGSALDYDPFTVIECFLPFIGFIQIPTSDLMDKKAKGGGKLELWYDINLLTGEFIASGFFTARAPENCLFHHAGTMMYSGPVTAANYSSFYKNIIGSAIQVISGAAAGGAAGPLGAIAGALGAATSGALNTAGTQAVQRSGNLSGSSSIMGCFTPFIVVKRPVQQLDSAGYGKVEGFPSFVYRKLQSVSGFCIVEAIELEGFSGMEEEAKELEQILKEGVYL